MTKINQLASSFRDKSGYVFQKGNKVLRTVTPLYRENYEFFIKSGLYRHLSGKGLLVKHNEVKKGKNLFPDKSVYKVIEPSFIPFISYPYEWCFCQLLQAAKLTLLIQKTALEYKMTLKDASAYNVQFIGNKPVFIDTLSFEKLHPNTPWIAYAQFCRHFLAPLALLKFCDLRLNGLSRIFLDGVDLDLAVKLLPLKTFLNLHLLIHLYLHQKGGKALEGEQSVEKIKKQSFSRRNLDNLIDSLTSAVESLSGNGRESFWSNYYTDNNYSKTAFNSKIEITKKYLKIIKPKTVADIGANTGLFSRLAAGYSKYCLSLDNDPVSVDENFRINKSEKKENILPLVADLFNPSPGIGWQNNERSSLLHRLKVDCSLALAISHHLYFTGLIDFSYQAKFFSIVSPFLIIEYVPSTDSQIKRLIGLRTDDFSDYSQKSFLNSFSRYFTILKKTAISDSSRLLFLMKRKGER